MIKHGKSIFNEEKVPDKLIYQDSSDDSNQHANPEMVQISVRKEVGSENQCTLFNVMHVNFVFTPFWIWGTWDM